MSERNRNTRSLTACAAWLHEHMVEWADASCDVDVDGTITTLMQRIADVLVYAARGEALPVKDALQLQLSGQDTWNNTFLLDWPPERAALKRRSRQLAALLFLSSHNVFAPPEVFAAYVAHHTDDAEKCVLMCLKVSKALVRGGEASEAQRMLTWAAAIVGAVRYPSRQQSRQWSLEIQFAQLHLCWRSGRVEEVAAVAQQLAADTTDSATYREALLEFIYTAALDAAAAPEEGGAAKECEATLQSLLSLSLRLQNPEKVRTVKQQTLLGVTHLQQSCSFLRSGDYDAAVGAATVAFDLLHTFEPLVVRLRAEALRHNADEAADVFAAVCHHESVPVAELAALATCVVESNPGIGQRVAALLQSRLLADDAPATTEERMANALRYACFLLHVRAEWSLFSLLDMTEAAAHPLAVTAHRFLFCALWRLAVSDEETSPADGASEPATAAAAPALSALLRWRCLRVALTHFAPQQSSPAERQSLLLDMARIVIVLHRETPAFPSTTAMADVDVREGDAASLVQVTWDLWVEEDGGEAWEAPPSQQQQLPAQLTDVLLTQAHLALLLGRRSEALQRVRCVWRTEQETNGSTTCGSSSPTSAARACASLLHALLQHGRYKDAGAVAQLCLPLLHSPPPTWTLEFAKVCVLGFLASSNDGDTGALHDVADLLDAHVCALLTAASDTAAAPLEPAAAQWWTRLLWYISDGVAETRPAQAVRLSFAAAVLLKGNAPAESGPARELLGSRLLTLLQTEVRLFTLGQPALHLAELQRAQSMLLEVCCPEAEVYAAAPFPMYRQTVVCRLASVEGELRAVEDAGQLTPATTDCAAHITALCTLAGVAVGDLEGIAAACHRVATALPAAPLLHHAAVTLQIAAAELHCRSAAHDGDHEQLCATLSLLYEAHAFAHDGDAKAAVFVSLLALLRDAALPLADTVVAVLRTRTLEQCAQPTRVVRLVETSVEFFAVEAWNESVQWNVLAQREAVAKWRTWALSLADLLDSSNPTRAAITDYASQMPLL